MDKYSDEHAGDIDESDDGAGKSSSGGSPRSGLHATPKHVILVPFLADERIFPAASSVLPAIHSKDTAVSLPSLEWFQLIRSLI